MFMEICHAISIRERVAILVTDGFETVELTKPREATR